MRKASIGLFGIALALAMVGIIPLLGWLNWGAIVFALLAIVVGIAGTFVKGPSQEPGMARPSAPLVSVLGGTLILAVSLVRLLLGGGLV